MKTRPHHRQNYTEALQGIFLGLLIVASGVLVFFAWDEIKHAFFPCRTPITYSLGDFDQRFEISQEQFMAAVTAAEKIWERDVDLNLFQSKPNGKLAINLVYDYRQAGTERLKELGINIETNNDSYEKLKAEYDQVYVTYAAQKDELDAMLTAHDERSAAYEAEVTRTNDKGGATPKEYRQLEVERKALNSEAEAINAKVQDINDTADTVNALAEALNQLADKLNITADRYNKIGSKLGDEFVEGTYGAGTDGNNITIYQFEDQDKLIRVLAHELGHALGLGHIDDPEAIMYRLNEGENKSLSSADIAALKQMCRID